MRRPTRGGKQRRTRKPYNNAGQMWKETFRYLQTIARPGTTPRVEETVFHVVGPPRRLGLKPEATQSEVRTSADWASMIRFALAIHDERQTTEREWPLRI